MSERYRRHPDLRLAELAGEGVVLHLVTRQYFTVNETGLTILNALTEPRTSDELVATVAAAFEIEPAGAATDVTDFLAACTTAGILLRESA